MEMEIGFIGLGSMGGPMSRRLVEAGHKLTVFDTRKEAMEPLIKLGATAARSVADVADRVETVMTSLPSLDIGFKVACGEDGLTRATVSSATSIFRRRARAPRSKPPRSCRSAASSRSTAP
jgi:3-hydroxyisobutyrate dehydrogenase-like beta-hydroxyacid dehydrogenase